MILRPQLEPTDHQSVLDYYLAHYAEVHVVTCNKCGTDLAIEIRGEVSGYKMNDFGFTVLPFGDNLLSSRVRLDGSMGYQCGAMVENPVYKAGVADIKADRKLSATDKHDALLALEAVTPPLTRCNNDTRGTELEEAMSPSGTFLPHEVAAIKQRQVEIGWKPKVKIKGNKEVHETFTRERIK